MLKRHVNDCFKIKTKCWICDNAYIDGDVKVRNNHHITGKYGGSVHRSYCISQSEGL